MPTPTSLSQRAIDDTQRRLLNDGTVQTDTNMRSLDRLYTALEQRYPGTDKRQALALSPLIRYLSDIDTYSPMRRAHAFTSYTRRMQAVDKVNDLVEKYKAGENKIDYGAGVHRMPIPVSKLSEQDLRDAGFVPSYVAVPEIGQSEWRTWRHPFHNAHIHRHGANWRMHIDKYPSMAMQRLGMKMTQASGLPEYGKDLWAGVKHVMQEGFPGWVAAPGWYIYGTPRVGEADTRSTMTKVVRGTEGVLGSTALLALASKISTGGKAWNVLPSLSATAGYLGTAQLLHDAWMKRKDADDPSWWKAAVLGVGPLAGGAGAWYLTKLVLDSRKKKKRKQHTRKRLTGTANKLLDKVLYE